jgi:hypothetical protein
MMAKIKSKIVILATALLLFGNATADTSPSKLARFFDGDHSFGSLEVLAS